jgi:hypothetical protein
MAFVIFLGLQFVSSDFVDPDAYYHIVLAESPTRYLDTKFPWASATTLRETFADLHWLYHLALWPFVRVDRVIGAKVATAVFSAMAAATLFWLLRYLRVPIPAFWTFAAFAFSASALVRYNLVKASAWALMFLLVAIWAMWEQRWKTVLIVGALFTLTYGAILLLPVVAGIFTVVRYAEARGWVRSGGGADGGGGKALARFPWQPVGYTVAGMVLGLILHPQFPATVSLFVRAFQVVNRPPETVFSRWHEWHGAGPFSFFVHSLPLVVLWLWGIGRGLRHRDWTGREIFVVAISVFLYALTLRHGRFIEYWAPFAALSAAVTLREPARRWFEKIAANLSQWAGVLVLVLFLVAVYIGLVAVWLRLGGGSIWTFKGAMSWLAEHSEAGEIVFHARWDQFPHLFFWNQKNYYIVGLDAVYLYRYDPGLYWQHWHISKDHAGTCKMRECGPMSPQEQERSIVEAITKDFRASYVLVVKGENPRLRQTLERHREVFERAYDDSHVSVYRVIRR